jgi:nucleoside 2-deoxyribosyltransferase
MTEAGQQDLEDAIAERLRGAGLKFATERAIAGLAPDFIVYAPDGRQFIVETRHWDFPGLTTEAGRQAQLYQDTTKVDGAFVVIPSLKRNLASKGVVTLDGLIPALQAEIQATKTRTKAAETSKANKLIFAAMPFAPQYEDVFFVAMTYAADQVGAVCDRVDRREFQGNVVEEIHRLIRKASAVIVDLSESEPTVLYEAGFAHALKNPCVHICSTPTDKLPFDVAQWKTTEYHSGQTHKLRKDLVQRLKAILD